MKKAIEYIIRAKDATGAGIKSAMERIKSLAAGVGRNLTNIQSGLSMAMGAVQKFASVFTKAIGEAFKFEKATSDFKVLLGSIDAAKEHMADLRSFAASTPLTFEDLAKSSKLLLSFGASVDEVMPAMKMLGDIAMGDAQKFQGLSLVFAQVKSAGKLMGQDLLQMINQGFNPLTIISQQTGKSMSELKDMMSEGKISFEMVSEAMRIATSEGGLFNDAMKESAKTGEGMVSTLQDNWTEAVRTFGEAFSDAAKNGIGSLSEKIQQLTEDGSIEEWAERTAESISAIGGALKGIGSVFGAIWTGIKKTVGTAMAFGAGADQAWREGKSFKEQIAAGTEVAAAYWDREFDGGKEIERKKERRLYGNNNRTKKKATDTPSTAPTKTLEEMVNEASGAGKANHKADEAYADADVLAYHAANDPNNRFLQDRAFLAQEYADALASAKTEEEIKEIESAKRIAEKYIKAEEDAAKEIEEARKKVEKAIAKERKKEWNAYVKQAQKDLESLQDENAAAQDRLSAAQEKSRQAWGWYRDKDSLAAQLEEERAEAAAQKQFEKDFEKLRFRRDWRTAAAYGSGKRGALSLDEEAVRRVALAREEEAAAKEYARKTAEECARSAAALEAIQNTICTEG